MRNKIKLTNRFRSKLSYEIYLTLFICLVITILLNVFIQIAIEEYFNSMANEIIDKMKNNIFQDNIVSMSHYNEYINRIKQLRPIVDILIFFIYGMLVHYFIGKKTKYIEELSDGLKEIGNGNLEYRVPIRQNNEMTELAESLNKMTLALSERMDKEKEIIKNEEDLLMGISHDLRTPLTALIGYIYVIKDQQYESEDEKNEYLNTMLDKAYGLKKITENILKINEINHGKEEIELTCISDLEWYKMYLNDIKNLLNEHDYSVELTFPTDQKSYQLEIHEVYMSRVFQNLLSNIYKYSTDNHIWIKVEKKDNYIETTITNRCTHETALKSDKLTEKFYRVDTSREKVEGTGLGLSICKTIMKRQNGYFKVSSDLKEDLLSITLGVKKRNEQVHFPQLL